MGLQMTIHSVIIEIDTATFRQQPTLHATAAHLAEIIMESYIGQFATIRPVEEIADPDTGKLWGIVGAPVEPDQ